MRWVRFFSYLFFDKEMVGTQGMLAIKNFWRILLQVQDDD